MPINFDRQNTRVAEWAIQTEAGLKNSSNALGITHRSYSPSPKSSVGEIKHKVRYRNGIIEIVSFKFPRTLIWTHKGAGKGRGGLLGSTWTNAAGQKKTTNPKSFGKMGTGGRVAKPWFNNTIEAPAGIEKLATIVAEESADAIVNKLFIK